MAVTLLNNPEEINVALDSCINEDSVLRKLLKRPDVFDYLISTVSLVKPARVIYTTSLKNRVVVEQTRDFRNEGVCLYSSVNGLQITMEHDGVVYTRGFSNFKHGDYGSGALKKAEIYGLFSLMRFIILSIMHEMDVLEF